jgi:hypothetical protein
VDLRAQFALADAVRVLHDRADAAYAQTQARKKNLKNPVLLRAIAAIAGAAPPSSPDDSIGAPETNLHSLHYIQGALDALSNQIEGPDTAPSQSAQTAYATYSRMLETTLAEWNAVKKRLPR